MGMKYFLRSSMSFINYFNIVSAEIYSVILLFKYNILRSCSVSILSVMFGKSFLNSLNLSLPFINQEQITKAHCPPIMWAAYTSKHSSAKACLLAKLVDVSLIFDIPYIFYSTSQLVANIPIEYFTNYYCI